MRRRPKIALTGWNGQVRSVISGRSFHLLWLTSALLKMDPYGMLLAFGIAKIISGFYYKTPFPIQPMKAIGAVATTQAAQTITITPNAVYGAGLVTGVIWLLLGVTGAAKKVADLVSRPVAVGIVMGLGFGFMLEGIKMMSQEWISGWGCAVWHNGFADESHSARNVSVAHRGRIRCRGSRSPTLLDDLSTMRLISDCRRSRLAGMTWQEFAIGTVFPGAAAGSRSRLGNAVIAITEENNRLFPDRPVSREKGGDLNRHYESCSVRS